MATVISWFDTIDFQSNIKFKIILGGTANDVVDDIFVY